MSEHWRWWLICSLSHYDGNNVIFLNVQLEGQSQLDTSTHPAPSATSETRLTLRRIRYQLINNRTKRTSPSLLLAIQSIFPHISVGLEWLCRFLITRITRHVFEVAALNTFIIKTFTVYNAISRRVRHCATNHFRSWNLFMDAAVFLEPCSI